MNLPFEHLLSPDSDSHGIIGRIPYGEDLLDALERICSAYAVHAGAFTLIGAVRKATVGYYDQGRKAYEDPIVLDRALEIVSCTGNVSLKNGVPFVHAHAVFSDRDGRTYGGHLMKGTVVFACELLLRRFPRLHLERAEDPQTGLWLWK